MGVQDLAIAVWAVVLGGGVLWGVTGPRHRSTHVLLIVTALFTPFISFDLSRAAELPTEAWAICAAFLAVQCAHTLFHTVRPEATHADGPEVVFQPIMCIWAAVFVSGLDPALWYRGALGRTLFCFEIVFVSLAVLVYIYCSQMTSRADDEIDFVRYTLRSRSNADFVAGSAVGLMVTLYLSFGSPLYLAGAVVGFGLARLLLPPGAEAIERG